MLCCSARPRVGELGAHASCCTHQLVQGDALTLAVGQRAAVAADRGVVQAQLLVLVALPHRAPHARVLRPQLRRPATVTEHSFSPLA